MDEIWIFWKRFMLILIFSALIIDFTLTTEQKCQKLKRKSRSRSSKIGLSDWKIKIKVRLCRSSSKEFSRLWSIQENLLQCWRQKLLKERRIKRKNRKKRLFWTHCMARPKTLKTLVRLKMTMTIPKILCAHISSRAFATEERNAFIPTT